MGKRKSPRPIPPTKQISRSLDSIFADVLNAAGLDRLRELAERYRLAAMATGAILAARAMRDERADAPLAAVSLEIGDLLQNVYSDGPTNYQAATPPDAMQCSPDLSIERMLADVLTDDQLAAVVKSIANFVEGVKCLRRVVALSAGTGGTWSGSGKGFKATDQEEWHVHALTSEIDTQLAKVNLNPPAKGGAQ